MKKIGNVIAIIGFIFLAIAILLGIFVAVLFTFPNLSMFGLTAVNERDTEIIYTDATLASAFANGNFIIESTNSNVVVRMSSSGAAGEGTIIVHENATGVAFNSFKRTLVEWTQTLVDDVPYLKIKVLEPAGVVFNSNPTTVYLNLSSKTALHNFILQNKHSKVNFDFGDDIENEANQLHIDHLVVKSASSVLIPAYNTIDINDVEILSSKTKFTCGAVVNHDVLVSGYHGDQVFDAKINGDVKIYGDYNSFRGNQTGNVDFINANGSLTIDTVEHLKVQTSHANVSIGTSNAGIKMTTVDGSLSAVSIKDGGLNFVASANANVEVTQNLVGNVTVVHSGLGNTDLNGVAGNVDINSSEVDGGHINVGFIGEDRYDVKIRGYDGDITVTKIYGWTDILIREGAAGRATIKASFNRVTTDDNVIIAGGYAGAKGTGNVEIMMNDGWNEFDLKVYAAKAAHDYLANANGDLLTIGGAVNHIDHGASGTCGTLAVSTLGDFVIR